MGEHLTFENMEINTEYECVKYRPVFAKWGIYYVFAKWGIYYVVKVQKVGDINKRTMIITDGSILVDKFRLEFTRAKFSFKKIEIYSLNNTLIDVITIIGDHDSVVLG